MQQWEINFYTSELGKLRQTHEGLKSESSRLLQEHHARISPLVSELETMDNSFHNVRKDYDFSKLQAQNTHISNINKLESRVQSFIQQGLPENHPHITQARKEMLSLSDNHQNHLRRLDENFRKLETDHLQRTAPLRSKISQMQSDHESQLSEFDKRLAKITGVMNNYRSRLEQVGITASSWNERYSVRDYKYYKSPDEILPYKRLHDPKILPLECERCGISIPTGTFRRHDEKWGRVCIDCRDELKDRGYTSQDERE